MTTKGLQPRELAQAVGVRQGDIWTWAPGKAAEQDVEIIGFGTQGGEPVIETREIMPGFIGHRTHWNELTHFVHMAVFTCEAADREQYDKG